MSRRRAPGVVVMDLDDTLYLERDYVVSGLRAVGRRLAQDGTVNGFAVAAERLFAAGRRGDIFDGALAALGVAPDAALIARLVAVYREHRPDIALQPDAQAFLDRVAATRQLALITDGFRVAQRNKIAALRLDRWPFDPIVCTDDRGRSFWKPHRAAYDAVAARCGSRSLLYIADNPAKDFVTPRSLGWRTVQIDRPGRLHAPTPPDAAHRADCVVTSLDELGDARLDELLGPASLQGLAWAGVAP